MGRKKYLLRASEGELETPRYRLDHYVLLLDAEFAKFGESSVEQSLYDREVPPRVYYADPKLRTVVFCWCGCAFDSHLCGVALQVTTKVRRSLP